MIQEYLNAQLIPISEDGQIEKLKKTCIDLSKEVVKDKKKLLAYTLVAFDPEIPADDNIIVEVQGQISQSWQTFVPSTKDTAVSIIRAVILEVLETSSKDLNSASIIYYGARNVVSNFALGREKQILERFLSQLATSIEAAARKSWTFSPQKIEVPKSTAATVVLDELVPHVQPNAINAQGLADVFNKAFKRQSTEIKENQKDFVQINAMLHLRTHLVWWKEAKYSNTLNKSYRDIEDGIQQIALAFDYSDFIPVVYPVSVDYFLREVYAGLTSSPVKKIKLLQILQTIEKNAKSINGKLKDYDGVNHRISLLTFVRGILHSTFNAKDVKVRTGIDHSVELTWADFVVWIFHDLHSDKVAAQ